MDNPFKYIIDSFRGRFEVRFVIERMDGSLTVALSDDRGVVVRCALSGEQLGDPLKLKSAIQNIRSGLIKEQEQEQVLVGRAGRAGEGRACSR